MIYSESKETIKRLSPVHFTQIVTSLRTLKHHLRKLKNTNVISEIKSPIWFIKEGPQVILI